MRSILLIGIFSALQLSLTAQDTINIVEKSIRVPAMAPTTEYYGFAEGDKVIFNFWVEKGKDIKDVTIVEFPSAVKFAQHTVERVDNKVFEIPKKGVYKFEYFNSNILPRVVNIKIQRIPRDASTKSFNTNIKWVDRVDTTYRNTQTGFHLKSDTSFQEVLDKEVKLNPKTGTDNLHRSLVEFTLPANTVRWAFWIGVGQKGKQVFSEDQVKYSTVTSAYKSTNPLTGVVMGLSPMTQVKTGENVRYFFISKAEETQKFLAGASFGQFKQGDMVADFGLMNYPNKNSQKYFLGLSSDNPTQELLVQLKILAVVVLKDYESKGENVPVLSTSRIPVHEQ